MNPAKSLKLRKRIISRKLQIKNETLAVIKSTARILEIHK